MTDKSSSLLVDNGAGGDGENNNVANKQLPFTRYHVMMRPPRDAAVPTAMSRDVPIEVWSDFWSEAGEARREKERKRRLLIVLFALAAALFALLYGYLSADPNSGGVLLILVATALIYRYIPPSYKSATKLDDVCLEHARRFGELGYALECREERPPRDRPNGHYIYFYRLKRDSATASGERPLPPPPTTFGDALDLHPNGYLRVELVRGKNCECPPKLPFCGSRSSPCLPHYDYLPASLETSSLSASDWAEFWGKVDAASDATVSNRRNVLWITSFYVAVAYLPSIWRGAPDQLVFALSLMCLLFLLVGSYYVINFNRIDDDMHGIMMSYADKFYQAGIFVEYRREVDPSLWDSFGRLTGFMRYYLYLFPVAR